MKGGKRKSTAGGAGSSNPDHVQQSQQPSQNAGVYSSYPEMPVSDAAAAMLEYRQQQQQEQQLEQQEHQHQQENKEEGDYEEDGEDYFEDEDGEDGDKNMYDRFRNLEIRNENADGGADEVDEDEEVEDGDADKPKLAEGFYEIETVRKKRVRKGEVQYLIKWRGWPESANTWEPLDNLLSCSDVIEAFEESLKSGKMKSARRRKRKHGVSPHLQGKKAKLQQQQQQQQSSPAAATYNVPAVRVKIIEEPLQLLPPPSEVGTDAGGLNRAEPAQENENENGAKIVSPLSDERKEMNSSEPNLTNLDNLDEVAMRVPENRAPGGSPTNGAPSVDGNEAAQTGRRIGARRRKSGAVKRFKQDSSPCAADYTQDAASRTTNNRIQNAERLGNGMDSKNKFDAPKNVPAITEIIRAIDYSTNVSNIEQEVSVTFMAMRSDGKEVIVDNKFLKANYPLLLIDFYEQHLRYSPTE